MPPFRQTFALLCATAALTGCGGAGSSSGGHSASLSIAPAPTTPSHAGGHGLTETDCRTIPAPPQLSFQRYSAYDLGACLYSSVSAAGGAQDAGVKITSAAPDLGPAGDPAVRTAHGWTRFWVKDGLAKAWLVQTSGTIFCQVLAPTEAPDKLAAYALAWCNSAKAEILAR